MGDSFGGLGPRDEVSSEAEGPGRLIPHLMSFDAASWNAHASVCRCLLELVRRTQRRVIDPAAFVAAHLEKYPGWAGAPGETDILITGELIKELGLADTVQVYIDPDRLIRETKEAGYVGALLFVEKWPDLDDPARLNPVYHCMLAVELEEKGFTVWNPFQDGSVRESAWSWKSWYKLMMRGMVLSRTA